MEHLLATCKRNWILTLLCIVIITQVGILSANFIQNLDVDTANGLSLREYAETVISKCADKSYRPGCYDTEIPKLMDYISMEEAFEVTKIVQAHEGDGYAYCHVLGHNVSAKEAAKDPEKWKDVITRCPTGMCSNGCIHGAFQERFRTESMTDAEIDAILPELKTVCEPRGTWSPTGMETATCYHAVGHLLMYIAGGDIYKANQVCEQLDPRYAWLCFDGNFMQIFQPLEQEDFGLVKDIAPQTKLEAEAFCNNFTGLKKNSCYQESWPLYFNEIMTPAGLEKFCTYTEDTGARDRCYNALFYIISVQLKLDVEKITKFCAALPDTSKGLCFTNAAARMIETDYNLGEKAASVCSNADVYGVGEKCYNELIIQSAFNYHPNSSEAQHLCEVLPEPWETRCKERQ